MNEELKTVEKPCNEVRDKENRDFHKFGAATIIYAIFYLWCMYKNHSGITYVLFMIGTVFFIRFTLKQLNLSLKRGSIFYIVSMLLLAVSTFCTDDSRIIVFNNIANILLIICLLLDAFYDTKRWGLGKFVSSIVTVLILPIGEFLSPFEHLAWYLDKKRNGRNNKYLYIFLGIGITIPIFLVVFILLSSADAVFRNITGNVIENINFRDIENIVIIGFIMFLVSYCVLTFMSRRTIDEKVYDTRRYEPLIAIPVATVMTLLYLVFSAIQIIYLFVGGMELPSGYTYAEYAREGFFQLLIVSVLNLIIVLIGLQFFKNSKILKGILAVMSLCTIVMIASSAMRMIIYIQYYYLTFLRIMVLWSLVVLLVVFVGVISYIFNKSFPLFRYSMIVVTVLYISLAFLHPDYIIAKVNLAGTEDSNNTFFCGDEYDDFRMIATLNADAAPAIAEWLESKGYVYDASYCNEGYIPNVPYICASYYIAYINNQVGNMGMRDFNMSRYWAKSSFRDFNE